MGEVQLIDRNATWREDDQPCDSLPHRYFVGTGGEYAHLPRLATMNPARGHFYVEGLCGVVIHHPILTDEPVGPICGTCAGRELGLSDGAYAYRPRTWFHLPKRWCKSLEWVELPPAEVHGFTVTGLAQCLSCGHVGKTHYGGGPYNGTTKMVKHSHDGRGVICPQHGQRYLGSNGTSVRCSAWTAVGTCTLEPVRFGPWPAPVSKDGQSSGSDSTGSDRRETAAVPEDGDS